MGKRARAGGPPLFASRAWTKRVILAPRGLVAKHPDVVCRDADALVVQATAAAPPGHEAETRALGASRRRSPVLSGTTRDTKRSIRPFLSDRRTVVRREQIRNPLRHRPAAYLPVPERMLMLLHFYGSQPMPFSAAPDA